MRLDQDQKNEGGGPSIIPEKQPTAQQGTECIFETEFSVLSMKPFSPKTISRGNIEHFSLVYNSLMKTDKIPLMTLAASAFPHNVSWKPGQKDCFPPEQQWNWVMLSPPRMWYQIDQTQLIMHNNSKVTTAVSLRRHLKW